jgi:hypothetical protein
MYFLLYKIIKPYFGGKLMYMDTDSFVFAHNMPNNEDTYKEISQFFDTSDYSWDNEKKTRGIIGTLKDEFPLKKIKEFICLCAKTYMIRFDDDSTIIKNKGSKSNNLNIETFRNALYNTNFSIDEQQLTFRSFKHQVYTIGCNKTVLKCKTDTKRGERIDNRFTLAIGYNYLNE